MATPLAAGSSSVTASGLPSSPSGKAVTQRPGTKPCENCGVRLTAHSMGIHMEVCNKPFAPSISQSAAVVAPQSAVSTPASPIAVPQRRVSPGRRPSTPGKPKNTRTHTPLDATPRHQSTTTTYRKEDPLPSRTSAPATKTFQEAPRLPTVSDTRVNEISDDMTNLQRQMLEQQERHKREMFALKKEMESIKRSVSAEDRDFYQASQESTKLISKLSSKIDSLAVDVQEIQASHSALKKEVRQISKTASTSTQGSQQHSFVGTPNKTTNHRDDNSQWISHHQQQQQSSSRVTVEQDSRIDNLNSQLTTVQRDLQLLLKMSKSTQQQPQPQQQQQQFSPDPHTHSRHNNVSSRYDTRDDNLQLLNFAKEEFTDITRTAPTTKQQGGGALTPRHPDAGSTPHQHPIKRQGGGGEPSRVYREESMADDTVRRVVTAVQSQPSRSRTTTQQQPHHARNVAPQYPVDRTPHQQQHSGVHNDSRRVAFKRSPSRSSPPRPGEWRLDHRSASL